jgi:hypothetical protein
MRQAAKFRFSQLMTSVVRLAKVVVGNGAANSARRYPGGGVFNEGRGAMTMVNFEAGAGDRRPVSSKRTGC